MAIEGNAVTGDMFDETISFSANMRQKVDNYGRPVYSVLQYQYIDPGDDIWSYIDDEIKYFMSSGPVMRNMIKLQAGSIRLVIIIQFAGGGNRRKISKWRMVRRLLL